MKYTDVIKYLYSLERKKGTRLGLGSIKNLLKKINNPEKSLRCIHIGGTNGKGSVCAMIASILQEAGHSTGMYTSPHLSDFRERFLINNKKITKKDVVKYFLKIKKHITEQSFFEVITAMAFLYFKEKGVDFLVLEVGLGGRLDATNVVRPIISVITNVEIEHTDFLGETIEKIAYEKAGIIKRNIPVVSGAKGKALEVIKKVCRRKSSKLFITKKYSKNNSSFDINNYRNLRLSLKGDFQLRNCSTAVTTIDVLNHYYDKLTHLKCFSQHKKSRSGFFVSNSNIKNGLKKIKWRGRFEFVKKNILVDCAHNPSAFRVLAKELGMLKISRHYKKLIVIIGILGDKDIKKMIRIIEPLSEKMILTKAQTPRAEEPATIKGFVKDKAKAKIIKDVKKALSYAEKIAKKDNLILVTGSCFVVGEALK
jgi:dihydrofolate synthase/folylpolyglutamate synthase